MKLESDIFKSHSHLKYLILYVKVLTLNISHTFGKKVFFSSFFFFFFKYSSIFNIELMNIVNNKVINVEITNFYFSNWKSLLRFTEI
jgi:hypothetical protein